MTPREVARWAALGFACLLVLTAFTYAVIWLPGPDNNPRCHGGVQSIHNGPGDFKTVVCRDGSYHRLNG